MPLTHPVAVLNYGYWMRRFGGDPPVLGRPLVLDNKPYSLAGVLTPASAAARDACASPALGVW